jgi:hypothetical protein
MVTMDAYSHVTDGMQQVAAERIDNVLRRRKMGGERVANRGKRPALCKLCR